MDQRTAPDVSPYRVFSRARVGQAARRHADDARAGGSCRGCIRCTTGSTFPRSRKFICRCRGCSRSMSRRRSACFARSKAFSAPKTPRCPTSSASAARSRSANRRRRACCRRCWRAGRTCPRSISSPPTVFSIPNAVLEREGLMEKKGFPESYDLPALLRFLSDIKAGRRPVRAPVYSHLIYDVIPNHWIEIDRPDILDRRRSQCAASRALAQGRQGHSVRLRFLRFLDLSRCRRGRAAVLVRQPVPDAARHRVRRSEILFPSLRQIVRRRKRPTTATVDLDTASISSICTRIFCRRGRAPI